MDKKKYKKMKSKKLKSEYLNVRNKYEKMNSLLGQEVKESLILNH